jgi:thiol-disulfide isomerase/thioredoxin
MARLRGALVAVIGTVLVLAGCGEEPQASSPAADEPVVTTTPADDAASSPATAAEKPKKPAKPVPEQLKFTAKTVDGKNFAGKSLAGKPALLWFWAPWCSNCQAEAPTIAEAAANAKGVQFVGVAAQDQVPAMQDFVDQFELGSFPHIADTEADIWKRFGVTYQPAYAFVSSNGQIEVETDNLEDQELLDRVNALR